MLKFACFWSHFEFLEFDSWKKMICFATLNSSQAQLEGQVSKQEKQQLQDDTSPCWLVKRAIGTLESTVFDSCCSRLSPNPQTGVVTRLTGC